MGGKSLMENKKYGVPNLLSLHGKAAKEAWEAIINTPPVDFSKLKALAEEGRKEMMAEQINEH